MITKAVKLVAARLCVNCEVIHNSFRSCPVCGSPNFLILEKILGSLNDEKMNLLELTDIVEEVGDATGFHSGFNQRIEREVSR